MSVDEPLTVHVDIDIDENRLEGFTEKRWELEIDELFRNGELRLWQDSAGRDGYRREETDDGVDSSRRYPYPGGRGGRTKEIYSVLSKSQV